MVGQPLLVPMHHPVVFGDDPDDGGHRSHHRDNRGHHSVAHAADGEQGVMEGYRGAEG